MKVFAGVMGYKQLDVGEVAEEVMSGDHGMGLVRGLAICDFDRGLARGFAIRDFDRGLEKVVLRYVDGWEAQVKEREIHGANLGDIVHAVSLTDVAEELEMELWSRILSCAAKVFVHVVADGTSMGLEKAPLIHSH